MYRGINHTTQTYQNLPSPQVGINCKNCNKIKCLDDYGYCSSCSNMLGIDSIFNTVPIPLAHSLNNNNINLSSQQILSNDLKRSFTQLENQNSTNTKKSKKRSKIPNNYREVLDEFYRSKGIMNFEDYESITISNIPGPKQGSFKNHLHINNVKSPTLNTTQGLKVTDSIPQHNRNAKVLSRKQIPQRQASLNTTANFENSNHLQSHHHNHNHNNSPIPETEKSVNEFLNQLDKGLGYFKKGEHTHNWEDVIHATNRLRYELTEGVYSRD